MFQVNYTEEVSGNSYYWISRHSNDGYVGWLIDTEYSDGVDRTYWSVMIGTYEECQEYINKKEDSKEETYYVQETIGGWRQNAVFNGSYEQCMEYFDSNNCIYGNYDIVSEENYEVDYL